MEKYNIYEVDSKFYYNGIALVAAENVDEANRIIQSYRDCDENNTCDSWGWENVSKDNLVPELFSKEKGIILNRIHYCG